MVLVKCAFTHSHEAGKHLGHMSGDKFLSSKRERVGVPSIY